MTQPQAPQGQFPFQPVVPQGVPGQMPGYPQQGYPQYQQPMPVQPGYPQAQYGQVPMAQQLPPAAAPLAAGSLDEFFGQPTVGGGQALKFDVVGREYTFTVPRPIGKADVQQQTDTRGIPQFFRDGRPKFQMLVPGQLDDGTAVTWYVKGATREKLAAAMQAAGAPAGAPEAGSRIRVRYVADVQTGAGFNPRKDLDVWYVRPGDSAGVQAQTGEQLLAGQPIAPAQQFIPQAPVQQPAPAPVQQFAQPPAGVGPAPMPQAPVPSMPAQPVVQGPGGLPAAPEGLTPDQQAAYANLLAQMGQQPQG